MSLLSGGLSLLRFSALGPVPDEETLTAALADNLFRPFQDGSEEERSGWCDWRNPLITPAERDWVMQGRYAVLGLRLDTRRVPPALLKAHLELRIQNLMKEKDLAFIGKEARISLQDEVKAELLPKIMPTIKMYEVAWDLKGGVVMTTATSGKAVSALVGLFVKSFGVELHPMVPMVLATQRFSTATPEALMALDPYDLAVAE